MFQLSDYVGVGGGWGGGMFINHQFQSTTFRLIDLLIPKYFNLKIPLDPNQLIKIYTQSTCRNYFSRCFETEFSLPLEL